MNIKESFVEATSETTPPPTQKWKFIDKELEKRKSSNQERFLKRIEPIDSLYVRVNGKTLLNFASNDYLALSKHPLLQEYTIRFLKKFGCGATASRLVAGNFTCHEEIEEKLACLKHSETALLFNTGYQANISILPAIAGKETLIFSDRYNHYSLLQGASLSNARVFRYQHNDFDHLKKLLIRSSDYPFHSMRKIIVTESIFSMDGDQSDLYQLKNLADEFDAILFVDEAHATGVFGSNGMGLTVDYPVDLSMGTFGKAAGGFGAYLTCSRKMKQYLINCCGGIIYTTSLPPSVLGSICAALEIIPKMHLERSLLQKRARDLRESLQELGFSTAVSSSHIIPIIMPDEKRALDVSIWLENKGLFVPAIRPPSVPSHQSRLRISLTCALEDSHLSVLIDALRDWKKISGGL